MMHVTLSTGHARQSPRSEIKDPAIKKARRLIHEGGRLPKPVDMYELKWTSPPGTGACVYTVFRIDGPERHPLVTCGVAIDDEAGEKLWDLLIGSHRRATGTESPAHRPGAPWCAVVVQPASVLDPGAMGWLADFERVIAWAWVERMNRR